jgi:chemotaxis-related protein WspD
VEPRDKNPDQPLTATGQVTPLAVTLPLASETVDCWNKIGVAGDGSCVELPKVAHCRNCEVYAAAGARRLDRALPLNYRRDWTERFAREKKHIAPGWISAVIFRLGPEWLALPTRAFQEVTEMRPIHSLPHRQHSVVLGLINVRGELLICVSLARLLGIKGVLQPETPQARPRLVVAEWQRSVVAFPVDEIQGIHRYQSGELRPAPGAAPADSIFATGLLPWRHKLAGILDADLVFSTLNRSLS